MSWPSPLWSQSSSVTEKFKCSSPIVKQWLFSMHNLFVLHHLLRSGLVIQSWWRWLYIGGALSLRVFVSERAKAALTVISIIWTDARLYLSHTVYTRSFVQSYIRCSSLDPKQKISFWWIYCCGQISVCRSFTTLLQGRVTSLGFKSRESP